MKRPLKMFSIIMLCAGLFTACSKEKENNGSTNLQVRLTDAPAEFAEVNVDIKEIRVKFTDDSSGNGWQTLSTSAGIYNLLDFQNGKDTLLATGTVNWGSIRQIRAVLGTNNSIKVGTIVYPLTIPSGAESGLKIMLNKNLSKSLEIITLDFDALLSVKEENGGFKLRPVIKIK